jgi:outer membrane protein assembly factor BamB
MGGMGVHSVVHRWRLTGLGGALVVAVCLVACTSVAAPETGTAVTGRGLSAETTPASELPQLTSTGAGVKALWQAPLTDATVTGNLVVGLTSGGPARELEAISELTGQPTWTATLPRSEPEVLGMFARGGVVVVEVGHDVGTAPAAVLPVVTRDVVFDARSGRQLWNAGVPGGAALRLQHQPITYAQGLVVSGGASGGLIAREAHTGAVAWRTRPASCPQEVDEVDGYGDGLAADGGLLVVSYQCHSGRRSQVLVQRLAPRTGAQLWQWRSITVEEPRSFMDLSVVGAATQGELVVLSGQAGEPLVGRYVRSLPRPRLWPTSLGPFGGTDLLLALDARTGTPRWTELGGQLEEITLTDAVICETVVVGFECRDDQSGLQSRPILTTRRSEGDGPPYSGDGYAGVSGSVAGVVLSQAPSGAVSMRVFPVRGNGIIARATLRLGSATYGGANYEDFIVGAGPLPGGATLMLLRRVDVSNYPLLALRVSPSSRP